MKQYCCLIFATILLVGCAKKEEPIEYPLPDKIEHSTTGQSIGLAPADFIEKLKSTPGAVPLYLHDPAIPDEEYKRQLPGMLSLSQGEMLRVQDTMAIEKPRFLICLYGIDTKRYADLNVPYGYTSYYMIGGMYQLDQYFKKHPELATGG